MSWVSLLPEGSQWMRALKRSSLLVGRSHLCEEPSSIKHLPVCTRPGAEPTGWEKYVNPLPPDFGAISMLRPAGVLVAFSEIPADFSEGELIRLFQAAVGYSIRVFSLRAEDWASLEKMVYRLGEEVGALRQAQRWFREVQKTKESMKGVIASTHSQVGIAILQPVYPLIQVGGWACILGQWAGVEVVFKPGPLTWEVLLAQDPEVIVISLPGMRLGQVGEVLSKWVRLPQVQSLKAFRQKRIYAFTGVSGLFYPSPFLAHTIEAIYELAYKPNYRYNRHFGKLWASLL
ncbi:MAG: hypothetical protein RMJ66_05390 [Bacteroidia bacterium]|nr:hypothetical protein [Bacteroidia bacterium]MDW8134482.1 hypothetical protein [Bacteroidia bacterium]